MTIERKMLRKIFGPVLEDNQWRIKKNAELEKLFKDANFDAFIKLKCLRWMGRLQRMGDVRNTKKIYQANLHRKATQG
jgi:hypothetical protein